MNRVIFSQRTFNKSAASRWVAGGAILTLALLAASCAGQKGEPAPPVDGKGSRPLLYLGLEIDDIVQRVVTLGVEPGGTSLGTVAQATGVSWSPDGTRLAFVTPGGMSVNVKPLSGEETTVFSAPTQFHPNYPWTVWSPDGGAVALINLWWCGDGSRTSTLVIVDPDTGKKLFEWGPFAFWDARGTDWGPTNFTTPRSFRWSPDGTRILVAWDQVAVIDVQTGKFSLIFDGPAAAEWASDGEGVYYLEMERAIYSRNGTMTGLYFAPLGSDGRIDGEATKLLDFPAAGAGAGDAAGAPGVSLMSLSPDGSTLAISSGSQERMRSQIQFYETGPDGMFEFLSPTLELSFDGLVLAVEWAPDGSGVATFEMDESGATIRTHEFATGSWTTLATPEISLAQLDSVPKILSWAR